MSDSTVNQSTLSRHPSPEHLALHAGGDLSWPRGRRIAKHLEHCAHCQRAMSSHHSLRNELSALASSGADRISEPDRDLEDPPVTAEASLAPLVLAQIRATRRELMNTGTSWWRPLRLPVAVAALLLLVLVSVPIFDHWTRTLVEAPNTTPLHASASAAHFDADSLGSADSLARQLASVDPPRARRTAPPPTTPAAGSAPASETAALTTSSETAAPDSDPPDTLVQLVANDDLVVYWLVASD